MKTEQCDVCGDEVYHKHVQQHHTSYYYNTIIMACKDCHNRIHNEDGYHDDLKPEMSRKEAEDKLDREL